MSDVPELTHDSVTEAPGPEHPDRTSQPETATECVRVMIPVSQLTAHPGNVREDLELTTEFCASIAAAGVRVPLLVTVVGEGAYRVIEGHRRLAAAVKAGLEAVPCDLDPDRSGDEAGQYLDMLLANSDAYRRNFVPAEEAAALFAAHEAGASRTRLRKATGRKAEEIKTALQVAQITPETRTAAGDLTRQLDLEQLALLAEFDGDPGAVSRILDALHRGYNVEYEAERIRQDRAEAAEHNRLLDELQAAGVQITSDLPPGAVRLSQLLHEGDDLTAETHAACPGRGAFFLSWDLRHAVYYCTSPEEYGHSLLSGVSSCPAPGGDPADSPSDGMPKPGTGPVPVSETPDPTRKLVIEGNKAWQAAAEVRKRWLADVLFARRSAPREVAQFVARQLLTLPEPLRTGLAIAPGRVSFSEVTRQDAGKWVEICDTTAAARLPLLMLAPIAVTYEYAMTEGEGRNTWRTDNRYSPCPRAQAGEYLSFLASVGHTLAPIEQAVADGIPWTGDTPADTLTGHNDSPVSDDEAGSGNTGTGDDGERLTTDVTGDSGQAAA